MKLAEPRPAGEETATVQPPLAVVDGADHDLPDAAVDAEQADGPDAAVESEQPPTPSRRRRPAGSRRTRRTVSTPAAVGRTAGEAIEALRASGLNPAIEHEHTPHGDEHGLVLAQEPDGGEPLARGATVALWVGAPVVGADVPAEPAEVPEDPPAAVEEEVVALDDLADPWFEVPSRGPTEPDRVATADADDQPDPPREEPAAPPVATPGSAAAEPGDGRRVRLACIALAAGLLLFVVAPRLLGHHSSSPAGAPAAPATAGRPVRPPVPRHPRPPARRPERSSRLAPGPRHRRPRPPRRTQRSSHRPRNPARRHGPAPDSSSRPATVSPPATSPATPAGASPSVAEAPDETAVAPVPAPAEPQPASPSTSPKSAVEQEFATP